MFVYMSQDVTMVRESPNPESRAEIGKRLRLLREALGVTQATMAKHAGLTTTSAWTNYEKGIRRIGMDYAFRLKARLNVPTEYIYHGEMTRLPYDLAEKIHALLIVRTSRGRRKAAD